MMRGSMVAIILRWGTEGHGRDACQPVARGTPPPQGVAGFAAAMVLTTCGIMPRVADALGALFWSDDGNQIRTSEGKHGALDPGIRKTEPKRPRKSPDFARSGWCGNSTCSCGVAGVAHMAAGIKRRRKIPPDDDPPRGRQPIRAARLKRLIALGFAVVETRPARHLH